VRHDGNGAHQKKARQIEPGVLWDAFVESNRSLHESVRWVNQARVISAAPALVREYHETESVFGDGQVAFERGVGEGNT
jgi:hypothetical protein